MKSLLPSPPHIQAALWSSSLIILIAGCAQQAPHGSAKAAKVIVTKPVRLPIVEWDEYVGRILPVEEVEVRARVSGHLESTHFEEGQIVHQGDLLCVLDQRPFRIAVEQSEADLLAAMARTEEARAQLLQAEAEVRSIQIQHELADKLLERAKGLVARKAMSQEELDVRDSTFKQTNADLVVKAARIALTKAALATATADTRTARSRVANARLNLEYTEVRAPVTGRVSNRLVTDGNLISGGTEKSTMLTTIVSLDPIHCYFDADEQSFLKYTRLIESGHLSNFRDTRLPAFVGLADQSKQFPYKGHMDFLDNQLDRKTASMRGRIILLNHDLSLTPGLFAKVRIPGSGRYDAVLIPDSAIGTDQSEKFVLVVDDENIVRRQKIDIKQRARGLRIVREGLTGDERIIVRGLQRVRPGSLVEATSEETIAVDDGLPDDAQPLSREQWLPSYTKRQRKPIVEPLDQETASNLPESLIPTTEVPGSPPRHLATEVMP